MARLEREGVIRGYAVTIDWSLRHIWHRDGIQRTDTFLSLAERPGKHLAATLLADPVAEEDAL